MSEQWDAPNQQVVRPDESAPWEEGDGGSEQDVATPTPEPDPIPDGPSLDAMTKDELVEEASRRHIDISASATKAEIREAIEAT